MQVALKTALLMYSGSTRAVYVSLNVLPSISNSVKAGPKKDGMTKSKEGLFPDFDVELTTDWFRTNARAKDGGDEPTGFVSGAGRSL